MRSHFLKPMVVVATFSLVACNQDQDPPTSTDAGADMFGNDVVATPDVPIAEDVHAIDDGQGADEPDVTADIPIDNRPEDAPVDRRAPTRPDGGSFSCGYQGTLEHLVFTATLPTGALDRCDSVSLSVHRTVSGVLRSVTACSSRTSARTNPQRTTIIGTGPTRCWVSNLFVITEGRIHPAHDLFTAFRRFHCAAPVAARGIRRRDPPGSGGRR